MRADRHALDDVLPGPDDPPLRLLVCGINPGVESARTNIHYAGRGNRFWPALSASGLVPRPMAPSDQHLVARHGIGLTNLVSRPTATAAEVTTGELREGAGRLLELIRRHRPAATVVLGVTAYRKAFADRNARRGPQPGSAGIWLLDNPSGLNSHVTVQGLAARLAEAGRAAGLSCACG